MPSKTDSENSTQSAVAAGQKFHSVRMRRIIGEILRYAFLAVAAFISIFPFFWMIVCSTNNTVEVIAGKMWFGNEFGANLKHLFSDSANLELCERASQFGRYLRSHHRIRALYQFFGGVRIRDIPLQE